MRSFLEQVSVYHAESCTSQYEFAFHHFVGRDRTSHDVMNDFVSPIPSSIVMTTVIVMAIECCWIVSTCMILLRSGSEVDANAASGSADVFSPLRIRVRENCMNCVIRSFTTFK